MAKVVNLKDRENKTMYPRILPQCIIGGLSMGAVEVTNNSSNMTDNSKIYIYTGTEVGMLNGNWYYWNRTDWVSGGKYGGVEENVYTGERLILKQNFMNAREEVNNYYQAMITEELYPTLTSQDDIGTATDKPTVIFNAILKNGTSEFPNPLLNNEVWVGNPALVISNNKYYVRFRVFISVALYNKIESSDDCGIMITYSAIRHE